MKNMQVIKVYLVVLFLFNLLFLFFFIFPLILFIAKAEGNYI
jgi:hypothetical protein